MVCAASSYRGTCHSPVSRKARCMSITTNCPFATLVEAPGLRLFTILPSLACVGVGDADVLGGGVFGDAFGAAFAAQPRLFDAPEGCRCIGDDAGVEADHAELDLLCHPKEPVEIPAVEVRGEAVFRGVREPDGFLLCCES